MRFLGLPILFVVLACAGSTAPAQAFDIAMQDDQTILHGRWNRELALDQFEAIGGTYVRLNIDHKRDRKYDNDLHYGLRTPMSAYDNAVEAVRRRGMDVQFTLIWNRRLDPAFVAAWMGNIARHFGKKVNRYSVLNEPDLSLPLDGRCNGKGQRALMRKYPKNVVFAYGAWRAKGVLVKGHNVSLATACRQYWRGQQYRTIFNAASEAIHKANPDAQVLAGETSALAGLEWFVRGVYVKKLKGADGWAHHPFQLRDLTPDKRANGWGIGNLREFRKRVKLPLYLTEFGYPHPNSTMDKRVFGRRLKPSEVAQALPLAWQTAKDAGAKEMLQYQWYVKPPGRNEYWDTSINNTDDGSTTPAYKALKKLLLSW
jgi:hypothetical protein